MALQELETRRLQNPPMLFDALFCEESFEEEKGIEEDGGENTDQKMKKDSLFRFVLVENDMAWDDDELVSLISKEGETHVCLRSLISDEPLMVARKEAVDWILRVKQHHGFSALTIVLAVNYFDRFASRLTFQWDKPWMSQLVAVACLSLAAKVEETQVPLLLDLQVEESKYVFEARTIQRMELLVLSTLQWRMNPVTPISFFDHIIRRLGLKTHLHWEFLWRCERLIVSVIADSRVMGYLPSVLATATMLHVIEDVEPYNFLEYQNQLTNVLKISEEKLNECYKLIQEISESHGHTHNRINKRKHRSALGSPNGIIDASFSYDSSNDSWAVASSSPEPSFKRSRAQDQQMRLPSLNRVCGCSWRLGMKNHLHWEFLCRCERLVLFLIADSRVMAYLPSTLAAATMLHVIEDIELSNLLEYQNHLMSVLKISEKKVNECYKLIQEISESHGHHIHNQSRKRKNVSIPGSPKGVIDAYFNSDSSNDS